MTAGTGAPKVRIAGGGFASRFLARLAATVALGFGAAFGTLRLLLSRPLDGGYGSAWAALRKLALPESLLPILALPVLACALAVCVVTALLCVLAAHKVAGPLYRMDRVVDNCLSGDPIRAVFFRHGDRGAILADAFNAFVARLREDRKGCQALMARAEGAPARDPAAARAAKVAAAGEILERLSKYR